MLRLRMHTRAMQMNYSPRWNLSTIPDPELYSEVGRRRVSLRQNHGPKPQLSACPWCGQQFGVRAMRVHRPQCAAKPSKAR